jgi:membrane fusion protein, multidrug efflux system
VKASIVKAAIAATLVSLLSACSRTAPPAEALRPVRTVELQYANARETSRYFGSVQARHEVNQAFRVAGKVLERRVEIGQTVRAGDVLAVLDDTDYRLAEEAARQQHEAATARERQADSDWQRMQALKHDGSVSAYDDEHAKSTLLTARAAAAAEGRQLELARNQVMYTVLRASSAGVVTSLTLEVGQVVAAGQPVIAVANQAEPEIVVDVPEAHLTSFKNSRYTASLASTPDEKFELTLREISGEAAAQTRTYRARLKPVSQRALPLGSTATLVAEREIGGASLAAIPATAITQDKGAPALWTARPVGNEPIGTVQLAKVAVHGYRNDMVLVSGLPAGTLVVTAGVQKMSPGLRVALPAAAHGTYVSQVAP